MLSYVVQMGLPENTLRKQREGFEGSLGLIFCCFVSSAIMLPSWQEGVGQRKAETKAAAPLELYKDGPTSWERVPHDCHVRCGCGEGELPSNHLCAHQGRPPNQHFCYRVVRGHGRFLQTVNQKD